VIGSQSLRPRRVVALEAIEKLIELDGGAIVGSGVCSQMEITHAQTEGRFFVLESGLGLVVRPSAWRALAESALSLCADLAAADRCIRCSALRGSIVHTGVSSEDPEIRGASHAFVAFEYVALTPEAAAELEARRKLDPAAPALEARLDGVIEELESITADGVL
jgi:hypothetical protein